MASAQTDNVDTKLEVVVVPVSDVDRAKRFYTDLGWRLDGDFTLGKDARIVQVTPPGSQCSVFLGKGVSNAAPGSVQGLVLVVDDIDAARTQLAEGGAAVSEPFHDGFHPIGSATLPGPDPQRRSYMTFASFRDPDGNGWVLQEITTRLPGRVEPGPAATTDTSALIELLLETEHRHGQYEAKAPKHHWSQWYAAYIIARERGRDPDEAAREATQRVEGERR